MCIAVSRSDAFVDMSSVGRRVDSTRIRQQTVEDEPSAIALALTDRRFEWSHDHMTKLDQSGSSYLYILGDADRVRDQIEKRLLSNDLQGVSELSTNLTSGLATLVRALTQMPNTETIMAGGDDVLFRLKPETYSRDALEKAAAQFRLDTGCSISFGVANDVTHAYLNLRRAKASGGGIVGDSRDVK